MRGFAVLLFLCILIVSGEAQDEEGASSPMEKQELDALYSAIQGFVGEAWNGYELYPDPCGWTPIQGVDCEIKDGYWHVTSISIGSDSDNSVQCSEIATIDRHLFQLTHLKSLTVAGCFNSVSSPATLPSSEWEALSGNLENLEFRFNPGLAGTVPLGIFSLKHLQSLVLLQNGFTGKLPMEIGNLVNLKKLVLAGNRFGGEIPPAIGGLSELLILDASRNIFSGSLPTTLGGLTSAIKLDFSSNKLGGKLPNAWGSLKNLCLLDVGDNNITGGLPQSMEDLTSLNGLRTSNNPAMGGDLMGIRWESLKNVEYLDLSNSGLQGGIPDSILRMERLRFLDLNSNLLTGKISPRFAEMPNLGSLFLWRNRLSGRLDFEGVFYEKMGTRFGVWDNAELCYPLDKLPPPPAGQPPQGVTPCKRPITS